MPTNRRYTGEELEWIRVNYPSLGLARLEVAFENQFGSHRSKHALATKAHNMGLHVTRNDPKDRSGATSKMYWCREPEKTQWMLANDYGRVSATIDAFEKEFGIRLTRTQVSQFRSTHGTASKHSYGGKKRHPVGSEMKTNKGYVMVKVAENATVPCTKDNWRQKHHVIWEQANGQPVPDDCIISFADGNHDNYDPSNLVAVKKKVMGILNAKGYKWCDAETLKAAAHCAELDHAIRNAQLHKRTCWNCGKEFVPQNRESVNTKTCPDCVAQGIKYHGEYDNKGEGICAICGATFNKRRNNQRRCDDCIADKPKWAVSAQQRVKG